MKLDILAVGAHPDDVELSCAGTIAKEVDRGKKVGILDLTRGELGTRGTAEIRDREARDAAQVLGVRMRHNLEFSDAFFENNTSHKLEVIKIIRKYKPEIVLCNAIDDRHIDHGKAAKLVSDACFLSGLRKIETIMDGNKQPAWRPKHVFHYIQWKNLEPDFVVDISGYIDKSRSGKSIPIPVFLTKIARSPKHQFRALTSWIALVTGPETLAGLSIPSMPKALQQKGMWQ